MDASGLAEAFYTMFSVGLEASTDSAGRTVGDPYGGQRQSQYQPVNSSTAGNPTIEIVGELSASSTYWTPSKAEPPSLKSKTPAPSAKGTGASNFTAGEVAESYQTRSRPATAGKAVRHG